MYTSDSAAGGESAAGQLAETAFRKAEKRYQLRYEQAMRYRKGRVRGGKLTPQTTDLSDVVDVRSTATATTTATVTLADVQPLTCPSSSSSSSAGINCCNSSGSTAVRALVVHKHPGLVVFPAALPAAVQLQLMQAALEQWPEPPARTNHTKAYGNMLHGLFQAAQQGLALAQTQQEVEQPHQSHLASEPLLQQQQEQQLQQSCSALAQEQQHKECSQQAGAGQLQYRPGPQALGTSPWSVDGPGPTAALLLRKLRWVCLGPPYNWTDRVYEAHLPHTPLPQSLVDIACHYAALAERATDAAGSAQSCQRDVNTGPAQQAMTSVQLMLTTAAGRAGSGADCQDSSVGLAAEQQQAAGQVFVPDAALVNYYHAGDTLNGHRDDVERDLSQPIVTMSLGCDAVFLIGGLTRDVEPTALLLRSGDVVVMGQQARACYHGVPRVLTDRALAQDVLEAARQHGELYEQHIQHMQQYRINISVRSVH